MKRISFFSAIIVGLLILFDTGWTKVRVCVIPFENVGPQSGLDVSPERFTRLLLERVQNHPEFDLSFAEPGSSFCAGEGDILLKGEYSMPEPESGLDLDYRVMAYRSGTEIVRRSFENTRLDSVGQAIEHDLQTRIFCQLFLTSAPAGAEINLSDSFLGNTPLTARILKGSYQIEAVPDQENYHRETIHLDLNQDSLVHQISFRPKPFTLTIESNAKGDSIFFDQSYVGLTPDVDITAHQRGEHTLTIKRIEKKKEEKKRTEETTWRRRVPFQGTYLSINAKYDEPGNDHFRDMYSTFAGAEIGFGRYSGHVKMDASLFYLLPTSNPRPNFIDAAGSVQEIKRVWRFGLDLAFSIILPLGHLKRDRYPVFPYGGIGYQVASLNADVAADDWVGLEVRTESDFDFIQVDSKNWYYQAGLMFGWLNLGWKKTFEAKHTDFEGFFAGLAIKIK